jgi:amino acid adenylation domain-containing protein
MWMVDAIAAQARQRPGSPAIIDQAGVTTFSQLWQQGLVVAEALRAAGIPGGNSALTAIAAARGSLFVGAALGSWLAGCAYVPLDMLNPVLRLRAMVEEARPAVLLAGGDSAGSGALLGLPEIGISDRSGDAFVTAAVDVSRPGAAGVPAAAAVADPVAYVMYTSGTTGRPKGVVIGHASLANLARWFAGRYQITAQDRMLHTAGLGFDASVLEIFPFLAVGATVVACPDEDRLLTGAVADWCERFGCSVTFLSTALCERALATGFAPETLRYLITGGDRLRLPCPPPTAYTLINVYGPAESTVATTAHDVTSGAAGDTPPIGRLVSGAQLVVCGQDQREVAPGDAGELYIGGAPLAHGYLHQPELTSERFVRLPGRSGRWYRTGDLGQWAGSGGADDVLLFCGRADREQLAVRGVRVEAGEIEAALLAVPGVIAAAVTVPQVAGVALAAVLAASDQLSPRFLRRALAARIPAYLIPDQFIMVGQLPLTANGKVDRQAVAQLVAVRLKDTTLGA